MKMNCEDVCGRIGVEKFRDTILSKALSRVPALSSSGPWIAGGAVRKTLQGVKPDSDWDFFFANEKQAELFESDLVYMGASLVSKNNKNSTYMIPAFVPEGLEGEGIKLPEMKVQAIKFRYYKNAEEVIDSFDFTITQFAFDGNDLYMGDFSLWDLARKRLVPHKISFGVSSMRRMLKYASQGFTVCSGALTNILEQVVRDPSIIQSNTLYID